MPVVAGDVADIAGIEIHREHVRAGVEHAHAGLAFDVVLPLIWIEMPMHAPHRPGWNRLEHRGNGGGDFETVYIGKRSCTIPGPVQPGARCERERERLGRS